MILKTSKSRSLMGALFFSIVAVLLTVNDKTIEIAIHSSYERYMALRPGFSSARNLSDSGGLIQYQSVFQKSWAMIASIPQILFALDADAERSNIDEFDIVIKFENYRKTVLLESRIE